MKEEYILHDRPSSQIKKLILVNKQDNIGEYEIYTKWPNYPELDNYMRIGFDLNNIIDYIDFDGGPFITRGYILSDGCKVMAFKHDNFKNITVIVQECNS